LDRLPTKQLSQPQTLDSIDTWYAQPRPSWGRALRLRQDQPLTWTLADKRRRTLRMLPSLNHGAPGPADLIVFCDGQEVHRRTIQPDPSTPWEVDLPACSKLQLRLESDLKLSVTLGDPHVVERGGQGEQR
jgi:hypothetical protein